MQLYYQILISTPECSAAEETTVAAVEQLNEASTSISCKNNFSEISNSSDSNRLKTDKIQNIKVQQIIDNHKKKLDDDLVKNLNNNYEDDDSNSSTCSNNRYSISIDKPVKPTKVTLVKNNIKHMSNDPTKDLPSKNKTDFKSLRSNDAKYTTDIKLTKTNHKIESKVKVREPTSFNDIFTHMKKEEEHQQQHKSKNDLNVSRKEPSSKSMQKTAAAAAITSPNIVVSIPQSRRISMSDENVENLSLAMLKTANKKNKANSYKQSISVDENLLRKYAGTDDVKRDIPKLKIELSSLRTKVTTIPNEKKSRDQEFERSYHSQVDLTEYAKHIGLKPIDRDPEFDVTNKYENSDKSSHKKRKKSNKHSKEPGSKRRKMHAEISSQEEESLKLKVKITANKPSKHERKSSSDEKKTSPQHEQHKLEEKKKLLELRKVRHKPKSDDADVIITQITYPSQSSSTVFAKPKPVQQQQQDIKKPLPKTYLPGMKAQSKLPDIRPINNKIFSPPHVPNYPSFTMPAQKLYQPRLAPISSTTHAALKRSASIDGYLPLQKQAKLEPISRKVIPNLIRTNSKVYSPTDRKPEPYYNSAMSATYTHEITTKKQAPILLPPTSISVTKIKDIPKLSPTSTITRPALEIVRIPSTTPTLDQQAAAKQPQRPIPQTIPLAKIKRASQSSLSPFSTTKMSNGGSSKDKKPLIRLDTTPLDLSGKSIDMKNMSPKNKSPPPAPPIDIIDITTPTKSINEKSTKQENLVNNKVQRTNEIKSGNLPKSNPDANLVKSISGDVTKIYTSLASTTTQWSPRTETASMLLDRKINELKNNEQRLQNLKLLSESALNREKLSVSTSTSAVTTTTTVNNRQQLSSTMPKLNDINNKMIRPAPVRQQNASVRNVPNPSALAFRYHEMVPKQSPPSSSSFSTNSSSSPPPTPPSSTNVPVTSSKTLSASPLNSSSSNSTTAQQLMSLATSANTTTIGTNQTLPSLTTKMVSPTTTTTVATAATTTTPTINQQQQLIKQNQHQQQQQVQNIKSNTSSNVQSNNGSTAAATTTTVTTNNNDTNDAKLIAAKKNLHIEKLAATLRAAAASENSSGNTITTVA